MTEYYREKSKNLKTGRKKILSPQTIEKMKEFAAKGYTTPELANMYCVSEKTVKRYLQGFKRKKGRRRNDVRNTLNKKWIKKK